MKKITVVVLTACVLLVFCSQMVSAQGEIEIKVKVEKKNSQDVHYIDMGEKYAYAVPQGSIIKWKCAYPFSLQFEEDAFFENTEVTDTTLAKERKVKLDAQTNHIYKYTVSLNIGNESPLLLDPVIIIIPPRK